MALPRRIPVALLMPVAVLVVAAVWAPSGAAQDASAPGALSCSATDAQFEQAGEDWMGRMLGTEQAHSAMDQLMTSMMGSTGERQMHVYMGRRISGCGGGTIPGGFGRMMQGMGGMVAIMGGQSGGYAPGSMMGGYTRSSAADDNEDDGPSAGAMVGMMAVLIGAVAVAFLVFRPWRSRGGPGGSPADLLDRRLASGELSAAEYRSAKELLKGG